MSAPLTLAVRELGGTGAPLVVLHGLLGSARNWQSAGVALADFQKKLNRLTLKVTGAPTEKLKVTWGDVAKVFTAAQLRKGVNLAAEFPQNPTSPAFAKIWQAVVAKQAYETKQIKALFRSPEARKDKEAVVKSSQVEFERLAAALQAAVRPVDSTLRIEPVR